MARPESGVAPSATESDDDPLVLAITALDEISDGEASELRGWPEARVAASAARVLQRLGRVEERRLARPLGASDCGHSLGDLPPDEVRERAGPRLTDELLELLAPLWAGLGRAIGCDLRTGKRGWTRWTSKRFGRTRAPRGPRTVEAIYGSCGIASFSRKPSRRAAAAVGRGALGKGTARYRLLRFGQRLGSRRCAGPPVCKGGHSP